jgi:hypothetical protein
MRSHAPVLLLLFAAACSAGESSAQTEGRPAFTGGGCSLTFVANNPTLTRPAHSSGLVKFVARNVNCPTNSSWSISATRTGAITSVSGITPAVFSLASGASQTVLMTWTSGAAGQGTVTAHAETDGPAGSFTATTTFTIN